MVTVMGHGEAVDIDMPDTNLKSWSLRAAELKAVARRSGQQRCRSGRPRWRLP